MYRDYSPRGVRFYYVYKALAHPETNGYVTPFTLEERLLHVREARRTLGSEIPWICDTMANDLKHALGDAPNSEFVIDAEGRVARRRAWSDPEALRRDLEELVGPVENPTRAADLRLNTLPPPRVAARGVVERIELPGNLRPLRFEPQTGDEAQPFYAKLRAEADDGLLRGGEGRLYLGFFMDPIYHVHWNNLTKPIRVEIAAPEGVTVEPSTLIGPKVDEPADIDPREFLVEVTAGSGRGPLRLTVSYFACNDDEEWCKSIRQEYVVYLESDPDGGRVQRRGQRVPPLAGAGGPGGPGGRPGAPGGGPGPAGQRPALCQIVRIDADAGTLTLRTGDGREQDYRVPAGARLMRDGRPVEPAEFVRGDMGRFLAGEAEDADGELPVLRGLVVGP
ncbi:MAG TPA: hypothetical protein VML55_20825 [Planctomycetaceae bacterium]|nr:hypothetical protein [Planctomycetaceae bacterium]